MLPFLQRLSGASETGLPKISLPLAKAFTLKFKRPTFLKAQVKDGKVNILDGQGSNMIHSMAMANALVFLEEPAVYEVGTAVGCMLL